MQNTILIYRITTLPLHRNIKCLARTFEVDEESSLGETGRVYDKSDVGDAGVDFDGVTAERAAVCKVRRSRWRRRRRRPVPRRRSGHGRYLDVVLAPSCPLDIQLKIEDGEADRLSRLDAHSPLAIGVHVILVGIIRTGQVATTLELDGRCLTSGRRQRRTSTVD